MRHPEQEGTTMSEVQSSAQTYALGHTPEAFQRLLVQGQLFNPFTRRLLEDAGLQAGMHVLDVGCGPGDVSLLAAELVGEQGRNDLYVPLVSRTVGPGVLFQAFGRGLHRLFSPMPVGRAEFSNRYQKRF
jgi:SAM-dependent methyltransferase